MTELIKSIIIFVYQMKIKLDQTNVEWHIKLANNQKTTLLQLEGMNLKSKDL